MMIPHHQGAIEMAEAELRYGDQQQEIAAMRLALGRLLPSSAAARTHSLAVPQESLRSGPDPSSTREISK
jgi:hypothetical protein